MKTENENISWELLAKDVSGELSAAEHLQLQKELSKNPDIEKQMKKLWGDAHYAQALKDIDTDSAWNNVRSQMQNNKIRNIKWLGAIAAVLLIAIASSVFFGIFSASPEITVITAQNTEKVTLPDGTVVDLNHGSQLTYEENFNSDIRKVKLVGEAFFDVTRNEEQPFVIETQQLTIEVLGTSFNVKAYNNTTESEVIVSSGKVSVNAKEIDYNVVLSAGDAANYSSVSNNLATRKVFTSNYKAWKTKEIDFDETPLPEVLKTIEETYHITIELDESIVIDDEIFGGSFSQHSLEHVLDAVCTTFNYKYEKQNGVYFIAPIQ
ncbi:FecR family protein [Carboxylicivirga sp. RSCT41]|uniref:FecR family protein n=1 Tax=Carboxylicivirga agarovorans TaxID=3417570 RepID=UPI003D334D95